jgi:hypothetical protein
LRNIADQLKEESLTYGHFINPKNISIINLIYFKNKSDTRIFTSQYQKNSQYPSISIQTQKTPNSMSFRQTHVTNSARRSHANTIIKTREREGEFFRAETEQKPKAKKEKFIKTSLITMSLEEFALTWNNFTENVVSGFSTLFLQGNLCDVTLGN